MSLKKFDILCKIGEGAYSEVHKVMRKSDGNIYALKRVKFGSLTEKEKENSVNEIRILASISHPNVISFKEAFIDELSNTLCLVTELADGGDLHQKISIIKKRKTHMPESEIWQIFFQTLNGLKCLHDLNIFHRDIKCANVYLFQNGSIKIGDMNVSKVAKLGMLQTQIGTPYYASPEVWKDQPYDNKSDIWSLGCVIYEAASLCPPFQAPDMKGLYRRVITGDYPGIPSMYSEELMKVIRMMLRIDAWIRPDCDQLLVCPVVKLKCNFQEKDIPETHNELLDTIRVPKQIKSLAKSLPASNYESQKISKKYPEAFRVSYRIRSESKFVKLRGGDRAEKISKIAESYLHSRLYPIEKNGKNEAGLPPIRLNKLKPIWL